MSDPSKTERRASAVAIIPARYASSRFPGKPLADRTGKPMIQHVVERARQARLVGDVIVATDDQRIHDAVLAFGGHAMMTRADHPNGTTRIGEVIERLNDSSHKAGNGLPDIIVNVQGDEPEIDPAIIDQLIQGLIDDPQAPMATLAADFADDEDPGDPNIVKLVVDQHGYAMLFSRALIPHYRDPSQAAGAMPRYLKHPGLYAYRRDFVVTYVALMPTPNEQAEQLEQLRALEHGHRIKVVHADVRHHGIDTPQQYDAFVARYAKAR